MVAKRKQKHGSGGRQRTPGGCMLSGPMVRLCGEALWDIKPRG